MEKVKIKKTDFNNAENRAEFLLNSVLDMLCLSEFEDLSRSQQIAQLLLFYDNQVCNGGHLQYFHNKGIKQNLLLDNALIEVGAACQQKIFALACEKVKAHPIEQVNSLEQYHELAIEQDYEDLDMAYYACKPEIGEHILPKFIEENYLDFVIIED